MTREEAIKHLEDMKWLKGYSNTTVDDVPIGNVIDEIIALLKEQEPVGPKLGGNAGPFGTQWYQCGECSGQINPGDKYCRNCGREVSWNG